MVPEFSFDTPDIRPWMWSGSTSPFGLIDLGSGAGSLAAAPMAITVQGRRAVYGVDGDGAAVLFLPAWGLGLRSYQRSLRRLIAQGYRVYVPSLPGFGGTASLPPGDQDFCGQAAWVAAFLDEVGLTDPLFVIGHSFGAGVGVQLAHDFPSRVGYLVLIDSIGTSWSTPPPLNTKLASRRPLSSWAVDAWKQLIPFPARLQTLQAVWMDLTLNAVGSGWAGAQAAQMARTSDLSEALEDLRRNGQPLLELSNDEDAFIPDGCIRTLAAVLGGGHNELEPTQAWALGNPGAFEAVVQRVTQAQRSRGSGSTRRSPTRAVLELLKATDVPDAIATELVHRASPLWLMSDAPETLAADLALCHPPLAPDEVRAVARPVAGSSTMRLTVVAVDRPGLLADTAAVLASEGYPVTSASACSWRDRELALHTVNFDPGEGFGPQRWEELGQRLRTLGRGRRKLPTFHPVGTATVTVNGEGPGGAVVEVSAPDAVGLLWAICRWFADHDITIDAAHATTNYGTADDGFIVRGRCDGAALAAHLSPADHLQLDEDDPPSNGAHVDLSGAADDSVNAARDTDQRSSRL